MPRLIKSFSHAVNGIVYALKQEKNFRLQVAIGLLAVILMLAFPLEAWERVTLLLIIVVILILELVNTIFERLLDVVKPQLATYVREIKDLMSAAVLLASLFAVIIGLYIFLPYFLNIGYN